MEAERHRAHANSFGQAAELYDRARPTYPFDAIDWMLQSGPRAILDLGAGTGIFTRLLAQRAPDASITAVDPDAKMLAKVGDVPTLLGTAEHIPVDGATFDLVTCAQAWHWVDPERAVPEVARILRPGGWLAIVWNARDDRVSWVEAMRAVIHDSPAEEIAANPPVLTVPPGASAFGAVESFETTWSRPITRAGLDELVASRSMYLMADDAGRRAMLEGLHDVLDSHLDTAGRDDLELPYRTFAYRAQRRA